MKRITVFLVCSICFLIFISCVSDNAPSPDKNDFIDFFLDSNFSCSVIHDTPDVTQWKSETSRPLFIYHLLTDACAYYQDTHQVVASYDDDFNGVVRYFKQSEIDCVSQDLLGFSVRLLDISVDESDENAKLYEVRYPEYDLSISTPSGIIIGTPNIESYKYDGNIITIESDLFFREPDTLTEYTCTMKYEFYYMPENLYIPYRFFSCQMVDGSFPS